MHAARRGGAGVPRAVREPHAGIFPSHVEPGRRATTLKHAVRPRQNMQKSDSIIAMSTLLLRQYECRP